MTIASMRPGWRFLLAAVVLAAGMLAGVGAQRASADAHIVEPEFLCVAPWSGAFYYLPNGCPKGFQQVDLTAGPVDACASGFTTQMFLAQPGGACPGNHFPTQIGSGVDYLACGMNYTAMVMWLALGTPSCNGQLLGPVGPAPPTVVSGYSGLAEAAATRYKGDNSGKEIYLGIPDLGVGGNRVETEYPASSNWQSGTYAVTFAFDQPENKITTSISGPGGPAALEYDFDTLLAPNCAVANWNTMDIAVVDRNATHNIRFNNVVLGGFPLGDFGAEGWNNWTVTGFDFTQSWTMTGDLVVSTAFLNNETNKIQLTVGCLP